MSEVLPRGWEARPVRDLIEDFQPGFASGQKDVDGGVAHLRMNNIGLQGELVLDLIRTVPPELAKERHRLLRGDVLVCTTNSGKLVGKSAYFDLPGHYAFSNHLTRLRPKAGLVDGRFLRWSLWLEWKHGGFDDKCKHWVNQSTLPKDALLETEISLPPLAEQRRIVAKLEEVLGKVDASRARLAKIPALLKRFRQSVLAAACSGRLTANWRERNTSRSRGQNEPDTRGAADDLPHGWEWRDLGVYAENLDGRRIPIASTLRELRRGPYPYYGASGVIDSIDGYTHDGDFILIGEDGANLLSRSTPIAFLASGRIWVNNHAHVLRCRDEFPNAFLCAYINSIDLAPYVTGTAQPKLNQANMNKIKVPVPPLPEQQEIVRRVDALFALADRIEARFRQAQARVEQLTPALLAKAFRGELVPQDPADEPAAVLLERIRQGGPAMSAGPARTPYAEPERLGLKVAEPRPKPPRRRRG